jgi:hypothetical protein
LSSGDSVTEVCGRFAIGAIALLQERGLERLVEQRERLGDVRLRLDRNLVALGGRRELAAQLRRIGAQQRARIGGIVGTGLSSVPATRETYSRCRLRRMSGMSSPVTISLQIARWSVPYSSATVSASDGSRTLSSLLSSRCAISGP